MLSIRSDLLRHPTRVARSLVARTLERAAAAVREEPYPAAPSSDDADPFLPCSPEDEARWNQEWLRYLGVEFQTKLTTHAFYPEAPPLPDDPMAMIDHQLGDSPPLGIFAHREWIEGKRILEVGCGTGNLGKLIARHARYYIGTDYSTLALMIARLVSPANTEYVHLSDRSRLAEHFGTVDTAVGRYFWIHQNLELGRRLLRFLGAMVRPGGRVYADFFWPAPGGANGVKRVLAPDEPLSSRYPSSVFAYSRADVERLVAGSAFAILEERLHERMQRRYVVLQRA